MVPGQHVYGKGGERVPDALKWRVGNPTKKNYFSRNPKWNAKTNTGRADNDIDEYYFF
jgi:hypothetical protein